MEPQTQPHTRAIDGENEGRGAREQLSPNAYDCMIPFFPFFSLEKKYLQRSF